MSTALPAPAQPSEVRIARRETLSQLLRSKTFLVGAFIVAFWIFWALFNSGLTPYDPLDQTSDVLERPSSTYWFGTDSLGRDVFSRVLAGATSVLEIAPLAMLIGVVGGTAFGLITGDTRETALRSGLSLGPGTGWTDRN